MEEGESKRKTLLGESPTLKNSGTDMRMAGVRTRHRWTCGEVKAGHFLVAVLLDTDELPLIYHIWLQAFNGVWI